jgi:hypothetical protein
MKPTLDSPWDVPTTVQWDTIPYGKQAIIQGSKAVETTKWCSLAQSSLCPCETAHYRLEECWDYPDTPELIQEPLIALGIDRKKNQIPPTAATSPKVIGIQGMLRAAKGVLYKMFGMNENRFIHH